mmetsp:Transcript_62511/g.184894  ORF Transcript_62511/g.184894 Transcript_62511/m.184894 type:complete len:313 (+) Transcript_62511:133-1071(+)
MVILLQYFCLISPENGAINWKPLVQNTNFALCWDTYWIFIKGHSKVCQHIMKVVLAMFSKLFTHIVKHILDVRLNKNITVHRNIFCKCVHKFRRNYSPFLVRFLKVGVWILNGSITNRSATTFGINTQYAVQVNICIAANERNTTLYASFCHSILRILGNTWSYFQSEIVHICHFTIIAAFLKPFGGQIKKKTTLSTANINIQRQSEVVEITIRPIVRKIGLHLKPASKRIHMLTESCILFASFFENYSAPWRDVLFLFCLGIQFIFVRYQLLCFRRAVSQSEFDIGACKRTQSTSEAWRPNICRTRFSAHN